MQILQGAAIADEAGALQPGKVGKRQCSRPLFADPVGQCMVGEMVPAAIFPAG